MRRIHPIRSAAYRASRRKHILHEWYLGVRDSGRVRRSFPQLFDRSIMVASRHGLAPYYDDYVTTVSTSLMAISLELAVFLDVLCVTLKRRRLLDLGSGFSSYVLRRYATSAGPGHEVHSVDHDAHWLARTGSYLEGCGLAASGLSTWSEFRSREHAPFDLILHDMGGPQSDHFAYRLSVFPEVLDLLAPGGVLVLDDAHIRAYAPAVRRLLDGRGWQHWSLKQFVQDGFGRYALLATPS